MWWSLISSLIGDWSCHTMSYLWAERILLTCLLAILNWGALKPVDVSGALVRESPQASRDWISEGSTRFDINWIKKTKGLTAVDFSRCHVRVVLFIQDSFILEETHPSRERRPDRSVQEGHLDASLGGQAVFQALADRFDISVARFSKC